MSFENDTEVAEAVEYTAGDADADVRCDIFLASAAQISRSRASSLTDAGLVTIDGRTVGKSYKICAGDVLSVTFPPDMPCDAMPEDIPLDIVYEDDDIIIVNKPKGMVVHPAPGHATGTLVSALLYHCGGSLSGIGGTSRPGIVHRIDKDTSGLIAVAKNDTAHLSLSAQLENHSMSRVYYAILAGRLDDEGTIDANIARHPSDRKKMAVTKSGGRRAVTHFRTLAYSDGFSYAKFWLETGRTHQIRVHAASIGHPILGDEVYGGGESRFLKLHRRLIIGQCLHAGELTLTHPTTGEVMTFTCPLPQYFTELLRLLGIENVLQ